MAKIILLTQGKETIVDDDIYEELSKYKWCFCGGKRQNYAIRHNGNNGTVRMHRIIMQCKKGDIVDHLNGNGLDNRKENLRICTNSQNIQNSKRHKDNTSGYKGVCFHKLGKKWQASLSVNGKRKHLGLWNTKEDAARAYDISALKEYGDCAKINFH